MILVTGGSGLLGDALIKTLLGNGERVRALFHNTPIDIQHVNLEIVKGDLLDVFSIEDSLQGINDVYHCAGFVSYAPGMARKLYKVNVEGTANLVNACLNAGIRKLVHVSSVSALASNEKIVSEENPWNKPAGGSAYGKTKYLGEMEVWRAMAEGLNAVVVNPSIILGYGNWETGSAALFKNVYKEFPWYSDGTSGFVGVQDVVNAMVHLMESEVSEERFILSAENKSFREVFNCMAENYSKRAPYKKVTPFLAGLVWRWELLRSSFTGREPLVTRETARTAFKKTMYDNRKFLEAFPSFSYTPLQQTISESCKAFQQKLNRA
ncbi:MAG: NAD-dependent epimerase/dehydratase family protein [Chitinophagaceae bacterium]|nr:MAG: NAD-dependent epimerase/dehydratase family protein [Chitinophagaceae bacterium]